MKALFVGGDVHTAETIGLSLRLKWPDVQMAHVEGEERALEELASVSPVVIFLYMASRDARGLQFLQQIRAATDAIIVGLATTAEESEMVMALEAGADDLLHVPINASLLISRVCACLRRAGKSEAGPGLELKCGSLVINQDRYEVHVNHQSVYLTPIEFRLLYHLAKNKGRIVARQALEGLVWGGEGQSYTDSLRKYIHRLRQKLGDGNRETPHIVTVPRVGYKLVDSPEA